MRYEAKPGDISVFKNDKGGVETRPDYTGRVVVPEGVRAGDELRVALWLREGAKGKFLSGKVQLDDRAKRGLDASAAKSSQASPDRKRSDDTILGETVDDIPF